MSITGESKPVKNLQILHLFLNYFRLNPMHLTGLESFSSQQDFFLPRWRLWIPYSEKKKSK